MVYSRSKLLGHSYNFRKIYIGDKPLGSNCETSSMIMGSLPAGVAALVAPFKNSVFLSKNQFVGEITASFFNTNGLKVFSKSDWLVEGPAPESNSCPGEGQVEPALGLPKKLASMDLDLLWASFSFLSFSAFSAFLSNFSLSYRGSYAMR